MWGDGYVRPEVVVALGKRRVGDEVLDRGASLTESRRMSCRQLIKDLAGSIGRALVDGYDL